MSQGSLYSTILSTASLDGGVNDGFKDSTMEPSYGSIRLQPIILQDDIARLSNGITEAQAGNTFISTVIERKLLDFNILKSNFMVIGSEEIKREVVHDLEEKPLTLSGEKQKRVTEYTYLGTTIHEDGTSALALATLRKRYGRAKQMVFEIKSVIEDCRMDSIWWP